MERGCHWARATYLPARLQQQLLHMEDPRASRSRGRLRRTRIKGYRRRRIPTLPRRPRRRLHFRRSWRLTALPMTLVGLPWMCSLLSCRLRVPVALSPRPHSLLPLPLPLLQMYRRRCRAILREAPLKPCPQVVLHLLGRSLREDCLMAVLWSHQQSTTAGERAQCLA